MPRLCGDNSLAEGTGFLTFIQRFATEPEPKSASWRPLYGAKPLSNVVVKPLREDYDWSHPRISVKATRKGGSADMNDTASALLSVLRDGAPDALGVLSLILYLGSYLSLQLGLIRGDGWLFPTLNLAASLSLILSLTAQFNLYSMMVEVAWAVISVIGLIRLYIIYKYFHFTDEEQAAAKRLAPGLAKDRFRKLLSRGNWSDVSPGHVLTRESLPVTHLIYVASGVCRIQIDGTNVANIGAGGLIGEMTYHTGQPATATVIVDAASRILSFERAALEGFLDRNNDIRDALERSIAGDLRHKLAATTQTLTEDRRGGRVIL